MKRFGAYRWLRVAAMLGLCALLLILWPFFDKRPIMLVVGLSVGQAIGTLAFAIFLWVVLMDLRRKHVLGDETTGESMKPDRPSK